jgi:hypothetical protein
MREKYIKISRLKVGDIFCYRNVIYEVVMKNKWSTTCKYINDAITPIPKYLYRDFNNYTKVEI